MQFGGTSFFNSAQQLRQDKTKKWVTLSLFVLIVGWLAWFFMVPLPHTTVSHTAVFDTANTLTATFTPDALVQLQTSQTAELVLNDFPREIYGTTPVVIGRIDPILRDGYIEVGLQLESVDQPDLPYQRHLSGVVLVTTGHKTAAQLVWETVQSVSQ